MIRLLLELVMIRVGPRFNAPIVRIVLYGTEQTLCKTITYLGVEMYCTLW